MNHVPIAPLVETLQDINAVEGAALLGTQSQSVIHDALAALPSEKALLIASYLPGTVSLEETDSVELLKGIAGTVEQLMVPPIGVLPATTTIAGALDYLVHSQPVNGITYLYAIDEGEHLVGVVAMRDLLLGRPGQSLAEIMTIEPFSFSPETDLATAIRAGLSRRHRIYPVTQEDGRLIGLVYGWRLFERVATEISAQSGSMVGVGKEERVTTGILAAFRMRHPWLQINLMTAFAAAFVVGIFEDTIARIVVLAVFLPVLAVESRPKLTHPRG